MGISTALARQGFLNNINTSTSISALDVSGQVYGRLPVYDLSGLTSIDVSANYGTYANSYLYIRNSGFNQITLPTTIPTSQGGTFFQFKNSTGAYLSIIMSATLGLASPISISPSNAITLVVSPVSPNTMLLF